MWDKLFPPKWRHRNPAIRAEAVNLLRADDPNLAEVITRDADAGIRRLAARRLEDLDLLFEVMGSDSDDSVRDAAQRRIWQLLAGEAGSVPEEEAAKRLNRHKDPQMAEYLMRHSGQVVTRTMLLEKVWDYHFDPQTNVIDVHVSRLRAKIDRDFEQPLLHTVRGAGYMLCDRD